MAANAHAYTRLRKPKVLFIVYAGGDDLPNYQKMYTLLFNAITDALTCLEKGKEQTASRLLREAQQKNRRAVYPVEGCRCVGEKGVQWGKDRRKNRAISPFYRITVDKIPRF